MVAEEIKKIKIGGLQKSSLIDYPEKISAIVFTQGCNFRCPYCHNPELILPNSESLISAEETLNFLKSRVGKLDGVVITGGEPCLQEGLVDFIKEIKALGFAVKLDTNGSFPEVLKNLLTENLVDYVAMDIKGPVYKYSEIACCKVETLNILKSIDLIKNSGIDYEFRTTIVESQLKFEDFEKIGEMIKGAPKYYLQKFVPSKTLNKNFGSKKTFTDSGFKQIAGGLGKYAAEVYIR